MEVYCTIALFVKYEYKALQIIAYVNNNKQDLWYTLKTTQHFLRTKIRKNCKIKTYESIGNTVVNPPYNPASLAGRDDTCSRINYARSRVDFRN